MIILIAGGYVEQQKITLSGLGDTYGTVTLKDIWQFFSKENSVTIQYSLHF